MQLKSDNAVEKVYLGNPYHDLLPRRHIEIWPPAVPERTEKPGIKSNLVEACFDDDTVERDFLGLLLLLQILEQKIALAVTHYFVSATDGGVCNHHRLVEVGLIINLRQPVDRRLDLAMQQQV